MMSPDSVIKQYEFETESWGRMLSYFLQENVLFKTRLAEIVNNLSTNQELADAEMFQEEFLSQDRIITYLYGELLKQTALFEKDFHKDSEIFREVTKNHKRMANDMKKAEQLFTQLKQRFEDYLNQWLKVSTI